MIKKVKAYLSSLYLKKGFTLTEVLVTVLIIGVLAAIAYPVYKKSVTKARAAEAVNLIEMVKNRQVMAFSQKGKYFTNFSSIEKLTNSKEDKQGAQMTVGKDYNIYLNDAQSCVTAYYRKGTSAEFSFSTGYEVAGLGCSGAVCNSYGNILGETKSVCNCGSKTCDSGYTLNENTCSCECHLGCEGGGTCYAAYGGGQTRACASGCGTQHSSSTCNGPSWSGACSSPTQNQATTQACAEGCGTMTRVCNATCSGGSCDSWNKSQCKAPSQTQATTQSCGNGGSQTRTCNATCNGGSCSGWSACTGQKCDDKIKPDINRTCGKCGTQTRTVDCDGNSGNWQAGVWGSCFNEGECQAGTTQTCGGGNGTQTCSGSCGWGGCICNSGYHMEGGTCKPDRIDCNESSKPAASQTCASGCGTQSRSVTCDTSTGQWQTGGWSGACSSPTQRQPTSESCGGGRSRYRSCTASCSGGSCGSWGACSCDNPSYIEEGGVCRQPNCRWVAVGSGQCPGGRCTGYRSCDRLSTCTTYKYKDGYEEDCIRNTGLAPTNYSTYACRC